MSNEGNWLSLSETKSPNFDVISEKAPLCPPEFAVPIETLFTETTLEMLRAIFDEGPVTLTKFKDAVAKLLALDKEYSEVTVPKLFNAADTYQEGVVSFTNLSEYFYEDCQWRDIWMGELEKISLVVSGRIILPKLHRPPTVKKIELEEAHKLFSKDDSDSYWSNSFKPRKVKNLKTREMGKERPYESVESVGKVIVSTRDKEIQFFDLQSLEPYCLIHGLPSSACSIDAKMNSENLLIITFGDWHVVVSVCTIANAVKVLHKWSERPKVMSIVGISWELGTAHKEIVVARRKVHDKSVDRVVHMELLGGQVISCSMDPNISSSMGCGFPPLSDQMNFYGSSASVLRRPLGEEQTYKMSFGIQSVDIWEEKRFLATVGIDRVIRVWNMLTRGDAIGTFLGHVAPLRQIKFFPPVSVSISLTKNIRVGELKEFCCFFVFNSTISKIKGQDVIFMNYSKMSNAVAKNRLSGDKNNFSQTKKKHYPNFSKSRDVTCMHVEKTGNRLLTGHTNGILQEFNFVGGTRIKAMSKMQDTRESVPSSTVNGVTYVKSALNENILSIGWNRLVDLYLGGDSKRTEPVVSRTCYKGHQDDIWCVASTGPNILVTGSSEGLVILWNFTTAKIKGRLLPPSCEENGEHDTNKVTAVSIYKQDDPEELMYLFTAGPQRGMHTWEIYWKAKIFYYQGRIRPWMSSIRYFCPLSAYVQLRIIVAAGNLRHVYVFAMGKVEPMKGIKYNQRRLEFNTHLKETLPIPLPEVSLQEVRLTTAGMPDIRNTWTANRGGTPVLSICETHALLTGASRDRALVRTLSGHYIGTLGQNKEWNGYDSKTYLHPDIPACVKDNSSDYDFHPFEKLSTPQRETDVHGESSKIFPYDLELSDEEIGERASFMTVYKKSLLEFLKIENCFKVVYRNSLQKQKYSLTPIFKRNFDNELRRATEVKFFLGM